MEINVILGNIINFLFVALVFLVILLKISSHLRPFPVLQAYAAH